MRASDLLSKGCDVLSARGAEYDPAAGQERSMGRVVAAFNAATGANLTETEGWLFMVFLKAVRLHSAPGPHDDSAMDAAVYAALAGESKHRQQSRPPLTGSVTYQLDRPPEPAGKTQDGRG